MLVGLQPDDDTGTMFCCVLCAAVDCCSEGGDSDTRRRAAADLVRALTDTFEAQVTQLFTGYVGALLQVRICCQCTQFTLLGDPDSCMCMFHICGSW